MRQARRSLMMVDGANLALESFQRAAQRVPAYRTLLKEAGVQASQITQVRHFAQVPIMEKSATFQRFEIAQLCLDGELGPLASVLTSSGHSGIFAFGLTERGGASVAEWTDQLLDELYKVRSQPTLLINCLPMGVKVSTQACTLAETSVRPDMVVGLVRAFGHHYAQIILVGETAFIKRVLELGVDTGVDWKGLLVHVIVGEEPLAENGRKYLEQLLGITLRNPPKGTIVSSMGIAEIGLNLFFEAPPATALITLRRLLHENRGYREAVLGVSDWVPCLFTYDPRRIFVEFDSVGRLILTTLDPGLRLPLIRYATGDHGRFIRVPPELRPALDAAGISWDLLQTVPIVAIQGRGSHALAGALPVYPESVKEGLYHDVTLAALTTANFRLVSGPERARVRIQLSPGIKPDPALAPRFRAAIAHYVRAPIDVTCERYEHFVDGMSLDYERKFSYLGN